MMTRRRITRYLLFPIVAVGIIQWGLSLNEAPTSVERQKTIEIPEGASFHKVTHLLSREGLIAKPVYFRILGKLTRSEKRIKPGEYLLHTAMRPTELLEVLVGGRIVLHRAVIPEGSSSRQIATILEEADLVSADAFLQAVHDPALLKELEVDGESLEGYLFPETYQLGKRTPPYEIIKEMLRQFRTVYDDSFRERTDQLKMTQREIVTLASIIEKETAVSSERAIVSAVFHNRLKKKMRLQSDPTVIFALTDFDGNLTRKHLAISSPYNTYQVKGLPPGPISNPGRESIHAALYPADVDYLYFVSKNNGTHHFSKTIREHNDAVRKYQLERKSEVMCRSCTQKAG